MIQLTTRAMTHLKLSSKKLNLKQNECFRLDMTQKGIKLEVDQVRDGDAVFRHGSDALLALDPETNSNFEGLVMDFDESSKKLTFDS